MLVSLSQYHINVEVSFTFVEKNNPHIYSTFSWPHNILDIDECTPNPCANGQCTDGVNSYKCECSSGYDGPNCDNGKY